MGRHGRHSLAVLALVVGMATTALAAVPAQAITAPSGTTPDARPDFDARAGDRADVPAPVADARDALAKRLGSEGTVAADPVTGGLRSVLRTDGFLTAPSSADPAAVALDYARANASAFGLDAADLATLRLTDRATTADGLTHLAFAQGDDGVPAYDSALTATVAAGGRLVAIGGAPVHDLQAPSTDPPLGPAAARAAAQRDLGLAPDGRAGDVGTDPERTTTFPGTDDVATLTTLADPGGDRLAWRLTVSGEAPYVYEVLVDAASGAILARHSLTDFAAAPATVHDAHPGDGTDHQVDLSGWLTSPVTKLSGPNAHAYADRSPPDGIGGDSEVAPSAGSYDTPITPATAATSPAQRCPTVFDNRCTWDGVTGSSATANVRQVAAQVFYYVNTYHDWLAQPDIGFTTTSYNFQGADPVNAEVDDYAGTNNANFSTPPDGQPGKMQMFLFSAPYPAINGADDATLVYHEYTHGMTNRLVGGDGQANGLLARQSQAMGEGWSDYYALDFLAEEGLVDDTRSPGDIIVGGYVTDDPDTGIRTNALDCPVGAVDAVHCPGTGSAGAGGFTFGDLGRVVSYAAGVPLFEVHADGEIWAETLWDLREALGGQDARKLVTTALRMSPKQPSFLDMRNAILAADTAVDGGAHHDDIWAVFAARGMGYSASVTSANATRAHEAFDVPPIADGGAASAAALPLEQDTPVAIPVANPGTAPLTHVRAALTSATGGIAVPVANADLGTIPGGGSVNAAFIVRAAAAAQCGTVGALALKVTSDQGTRTIPYNLPVGTGSATVGTRAYGSPAAIPDNAPAGGLTSTLNVPTHGRVGRLRLTLAAAHGWIGDLHAWLTSPSGTTVDLLERPGVGTSTNYSPGNLVTATPLVLDDAATKPIQELVSTDTTVGGLYEPNEPLSRFAGEDRYGTWTLRITDGRALNAGTLSSWSLDTAAPACAITDAPTGLVDDAATFRARVDPGPASATTAAFELGPTADYGFRSPAVALLANSGLKDFTVSTPGLTPGATYHVRVVLMRGGQVVATGADRAFVAGADTPTNGRGGNNDGGGDTGGGGNGGGGTGGPGGDDGGGDTGGGTSGSGGGADVFSVPKATMKGMARTLRLDRKGRATLAFRATPVRARGTLALTYGKGYRTSGGRGAFTVPADGRVKLTVTASAKLRAALRKGSAAKKGVKVKVSTRIGVTTLTATLTIKPYAKPKTTSKR